MFYELVDTYVWYRVYVFTVVANTLGPTDTPTSSTLRFRLLFHRLHLLDNPLLFLPDAWFQRYVNFLSTISLSTCSFDLSPGKKYFFCSVNHCDFGGHVGRDSGRGVIVRRQDSHHKYGGVRTYEGQVRKVKRQDRVTPWGTEEPLFLLFPSRALHPVSNKSNDSRRSNPVSL